MMATSTSMSDETGSQFSTSAPADAAQYEPTWGEPGLLRSVGLIGINDLWGDLEERRCQRYAASRAGPPVMPGIAFQPCRNRVVGSRRRRLCSSPGAAKVRAMPGDVNRVVS